MRSVADLVENKHKHYEISFYSKTLYDSISYYDIPDLTDDEMSTLYCELCEILTSIKKQLNYYKITELTPEEEISYKKASKKILIVKSFREEVRYELEKRFQNNNGLDAEEITDLFVQRSEIFEKFTKSQRDFYDSFLSVLNETYGEDVVHELKQKAQERLTNRALKLSKS